MKIVVVSGEDIAGARLRYAQIISSIKNKGWDVININKEVKYNFADRLTSSSLFPKSVLFTVDDFKKIPINDLKWLGKNAQKYEGSLLIYCHGKLPATVKNALPKTTKFENFDLPKIIFQFLESFYPGNGKRALNHLEELLKNNPIEVVLLMLARHLRDLYWVLDGREGMSLPAWRAEKLKSQANKFTKEALKDTISSLADIDIKAKTSDSDPRFLLEIFIAEKLV